MMQQDYAVRIQDYGGVPLGNQGQGIVHQIAATPIVIEHTPQERERVVRGTEVVMDRARE